MFKKILVSLLFPIVACAAPQQPINGGTGIPNNNANTISTTTPVNLPADINLQNAYNHGNSIGLVTGGLQILDPSAVEQWNIFTEEGNDYIVQTGNTFIANTTGDIVPNTAFFQVASTTQGSIPAPAMTSMQETAIVSPAQGSQVFNSTNNTLDYFDNSAEKHVLLAIDKIVQGANMSVTPNSNGTVTLASTGGSGSTTQVQGTFTAASTSTTSVGTSDTPINIASPLYFNVINSVGTSVTTASVSGVTTPIIQNTSAGGRWGIARFDLTMSFATLATPTTFAFTVYTNTGATTFFKNVTLPTQSSSNQEIGFASPLVYLNTGDYMYLTVSVASGSAAFTTRNFEGSWVDTSVANIPSTDALGQGSNNLYLSDDGGTTYQYMTGTAFANDVPVFNSTGGGLIDSGLAKTNILTLATPAGGDLTGILPNPSLSSSGIAKVVAITQVSGTSQAMADTAPTNRYFLINGSLATLTLPTSPTVGHVFQIVEAGNASWSIAQNAGQSMVTSVGGNSVSTTPGTSGHTDGATDRDCIDFMYVDSGEFIIMSEQTSGAGIILN